MKVKCINNKGYENGLDVGEVYNVISSMHGFYEVDNKWGEKRCFELDRFELIEEAKVGLDVLDITNQGIKHDQHKLKPSLLFDDMPLAINEILKVLKFGADKYEEGNWLKVDNGMKRYRNASDRHRLQSSLEENDSESGLLHLAHEAVNTLMLLELKLREIDKLRRND